MDQTHPLADKFPLMSENELAELSADIKVNGCQEMITVLDGQILDGRNRWLACAMAKVTPGIKDISDVVKAGFIDPVSLVASLNIFRRHLSASQRSMVAAELLNDGSTTVTVKEVAEKAHVSPASVTRANRIKKEGSSKLNEAVEKGNVTVNEASKIVHLPKPEQDKQVALPPAKRQTRSQVSTATSKPVLLQPQAPRGGFQNTPSHPILIAMQNWFQDKKQSYAAYGTPKPDQWTYEELCEIVRKELK